MKSMFKRDQGYQNPSIIIIIKSMGPAYKRTLFTTINWSHCLAHELIAEFPHYKLMCLLGRIKGRKSISVIHCNTRVVPLYYSADISADYLMRTSSLINEPRKDRLSQVGWLGPSLVCNLTYHTGRKFS